MSEAKWIVKSSGRILGPMTMDDIVEAMRAKTFSVLDEIREPQMRWTFLREHPMLMQVVRQIRDEQSSGIENTQSTFVTSGRTITSSVTERIVEEHELTPNPTSGQAPMKSIAAVEKTVPASASGAKSFGVLTDAKVQQKIQRQTSQWKYIVYSLGALALVGAGVYLKMQAGPGMSNVAAVEKYKFAVDRAKRADFALGLKTVQEIENARGLSAEEKLLKAKLLLSQDPGNPIELKNTVDSLTAVGQNAIPVPLELLNGLVQAKFENYPEAIKFFEQALAKDRDSEVAILNLAVAQTKARQYSRAYKTLDGEKISENVGFFQLLKGLIALTWEDEAGSQTILESAYDEISDFTRGMEPRARSLRTGGFNSEPAPQKQKSLRSDFGRELRFERMLVRSLLARRLNRPDDYKSHLLSLLQTSPFESTKYMRSPLLTWAAFDWKSVIRPLCDRYFRNDEDSLVQGAYALCLAPTDLGRAQTVVVEASNKMPGNGYLEGSRFVILNQAGRKNEVEAGVRKYALTDNSLILWSRAVMMEEKRDWIAAEKAWLDYKRYDSGEPRMYYGLALAADGLTKKSDFDLAVATGYRYAPNYYPLMDWGPMREEY